MANAGVAHVTEPSDREIAITRVFKCPRSLLFEALTDAELITRWFGVFGGWSLVVCEVDFRAGGRFRFVWRSLDGRTVGFRGVYREIEPEARLVTSVKLDGDDEAAEAVGTLSFVEQDGVTTLTTTVLFPSREIRDGVLTSASEQGGIFGYDRLAELFGIATTWGRKRKFLSTTPEPERHADKAMDPRVRSALTVTGGLVVFFALTLGADALLRAYHIYPAFDQPLRGMRLNLLKLGYVILFAVVASYVTAWCAAANPVRHALMMGAAALVVGTAFSIPATMLHLNPVWFPVAFAVAAMPCAWLGGALVKLGPAPDKTKPRAKKNRATAAKATAVEQTAPNHASPKRDLLRPPQGLGRRRAFSSREIRDGRIPLDHPLRSIRRLTDTVLFELSPRLDRLYAGADRPPVPPDQVLRALLLQVLYAVRTERLLLEQLEYNMLFRWFVGVHPEDRVWPSDVFARSRDALVESGIVREFFVEVRTEVDGVGLLSDEHFIVDTAQLEGWTR